MLTSRYDLIDPAVPAVAGRLRQRGVHADVQVLCVCGELDVRLVACRHSGDVAVELLAAPDDCPCPAHWYAVRVCDAERQVWEGPPHEAPAGEVVAFVEALLAGHSAVVGYPRLG